MSISNALCFQYSLSKGVFVLQVYTILDVLGSAQAWRDWTSLGITLQM